MIEYKTTFDLFYEALGGKWKHLIVSELTKASKRPSELIGALPGISHRMLTKELKELVEDGLVQRELFAEVPVRVEYSLTEYGNSTLPLLEALCQWGEKHLERITTQSTSHIERVDRLDAVTREDQLIVKRSVRIDRSHG